MHTIILPSLVELIYLGHGEKDTGNWCFKNGTISFQDIFDCYRRKCPEKVLSIESDCSHSGQWVNDCAKLLDNFGIVPCGHRAREHNVLIIVSASCRPDQTAMEPCFSMEGFDDGASVRYLNKRVNDTVTFYGGDFTRLTCCRDPDKPCNSEKALKNYTWELATHGGLLSRLIIVRGRGPTWCFLLLSDPSEAYKERLRASNNIDVDIIEAGQGEEPPQHVRDRIFMWMSP